MRQSIVLPTLAFLYLLTVVNTDILAMKRAANEISAVATTTTIVSFSGLPQAFWWPLFSQCRIAVLVRVCRFLSDRYHYKNYQNILTNDPAMIAAHPVNCCRVYYRLMQEDNIEAMRALLRSDHQSEKNMLWFSSYESYMPSISVQMEKMIKEHIKKPFEIYESTPVEYNEFADIILHNDIERMKQYFKKQDEHTIVGALNEHVESVARYVSLAMLEVLKPFLKEKGDDGNGTLYIIQDRILARAAMKRNGWRVDIVEYLLANEANLKFEAAGDSIFQGGLTLAHEKNNYTLLHMCKDTGFNFNLEYVYKDVGSEFIFEHGSEGDYYRMICVNDEPDFDDKDWVSALRWALVKKNAQLVIALLIFGARPGYEDIDLAEQWGDELVLQSLRML